MISEQYSLTGKTALVVGGRGYLGRRFCLALQEAEAIVYAADLPEISKAAATDTNTIQVSGIRNLTIDVTNEQSVTSMIEDIKKDVKSIDILVYSVTAKPDDFYYPFTECSLEGWQKILRVELDGLFLVTNRVGSVMENAGQGSIIFISSIYGVVGNDQRIYKRANLDNLYGSTDVKKFDQIYAHAGYAASKGAVISMTRFLAAYWGGKGIRVNCITPGGIEHPGENKAFVETYSNRVPLGRKAKPEEISSSIIYLASDASSYVTGHNLIIDGGWTIW
ncbi:hypothetical protein BuS5_02389 [Desulfosarcina sp. BuS5]|uniref:SDR family oxidoreductase n=1 Tax=Desulfosarcina sp. BuS5 TaxID=933262 RepID=UPI0004839823|nr:SDR family oxidoreductase [Desulfosarcina sp. BuS5]WDN89421.1 hypothetical protein BuS5_02389 [Desulfosarcina sp. BuS5]